MLKPRRDANRKTTSDICAVSLSVRQNNGNIIKPIAKKSYTRSVMV